MVERFAPCKLVYMLIRAIPHVNRADVVYMVINMFRVAFGTNFRPPGSSDLQFDPGFAKNT